MQVTHRKFPSVSESQRTPRMAVAATPQGPAMPPPPEVPDLMAFDDSPHAPQQGTTAQQHLPAQQAATQPQGPSAGAIVPFGLGPIQELELGLHLLDDDLFGADVAHASYMQPLPAGEHAAARCSFSGHVADM